MGEILDKTIQTIITSPPYYKKRNYSQSSQLGIEKTPDEYLHRLLSVMSECKRVLKDNGCLFLVIGDSYDDRGCLRQIPAQVSLAMAREDWILRNKLVRFATNAKPECSKVRRWSCSHEFIYFFTKSMDYFFDMDQIRVPYTTEFASSLTAGTPKHHSINEDGKIQKQHSYIRHPLGAVPKDVIQLTLNQKADKYVPDHNEAEASLEHSDQFPEKLIKRFVLGTSRPGDKILDCFMGAGTTAKVALDNGRQVLGYEINPHFIDTTYERCSSCAGTSTTGKIQIHFQRR
jgi:site-specific DNA-methyltransferase (adenine-specific)